MLLSCALTGTAVAGKSVRQQFRLLRATTAAEVIARVKETMTDDWLEAEKRKDRVHILFDERSNMVEPLCDGPYPVIDENDVVIAHQVVEIGAEDLFTLDVKGQGVPALFRLSGSTFKSDRSVAPTGDTTKVATAFGIATRSGGPFAEYVEITLTHAEHLAGSEKPSKSESKVFKFSVNPLYQFQALGGVMYSNLGKRSFPTQALAAGSVISEDVGNKLAVAFCIAPYVWDSEGVDLFNLPPHGHRRLSPLIGLGFNDLGRDFYLGAGYQFTRGFFLIGGAHVVKTARLLPGLAVGAPIANGAQAGVEQAWQSEGFVGLTFPFDVFGNFLGKKDSVKLP